MQIEHKEGHPLKYQEQHYINFLYSSVLQNT